MIRKLIDQCPKEIDLTNDKHSEIITQIVESLLDAGFGISDLEEIEDQLIGKNEDSLIFILLALKIAKSKIIVTQTLEPVLISVVFAIYKEHNRIKKSSEHPHGEDFLLKKVRQLEWLFEGQSNIQWELILVDDGCPEGSGRIAQSIIEVYRLKDKVRVLNFSEAIEKKYRPASSISSTEESQKGASIIYGMWDAVQNSNALNQVIVYTDADLSTHLGQLMLLVDPLLNQNKTAAIGSRREPKSVVIKKGARNDRGKLFIYLWKRLIPNLENIVDTQFGFKAFRSEIVPQIIEDLIEKKFAFDIELLLRAELLNKDSIIKIPIAWIDSEEASTTTDIQPYLPMLKSIAKMSKKYFPEEQSSNEFIPFIESLDMDGFNWVLNNIPPDIVNREPDEFTEYDEVTVINFEKN